MHDTPQYRVRSDSLRHFHGHTASMTGSSNEPSIMACRLGGYCRKCDSVARNENSRCTAANG